MGGHYVGKFLIRVTLTNGISGFAMEVVDGALMICDNHESAARFLTPAGARNFYDKICDLPNFIDRSAFIEEATIVKSSKF